MVRGESGDVPPAAEAEAEPAFEAGRRTGGRSFSGLPVEVALEELETLDVPRRRWSDGERDEPAPPRLDFQRPQPPTPALLIDDPTADPRNRVTPPGGPQFLGRTATPVSPERRRVPAAKLPDIPPPGTRISAWSRSGPVVTLKSPHAGRARRVALRLLVLVCLSVAVIVGYPRVQTLMRERSVPSDLRAYVDGKGVQYAPATQGFAVRLPKQPVARDQALAATAGAPAMFMHRSIASGSDYSIVIRVVDVPDGTSLPFGAVAALANRSIGGGAPVDVRPVTFAGGPAYDYALHSQPATHARVFLRGSRLYVISVQSKSADLVLQNLAKSFRLTT